MTPGVNLLILAAQCAHARDVIQHASESNMRSESEKRKKFDGIADVDSWLIGSDGAASVFQKFEHTSTGSFGPIKPASFSQKKLDLVQEDNASDLSTQHPEKLKNPMLVAPNIKDLFNWHPFAPRAHPLAALVEQPADPAAPTEAPTADPSADPPTEAPTVPPTAPPTVPPTVPPTADPAAPTADPAVPTADPAAPTVAPTFDPSALPPTVDPSAPPVADVAEESGGLGFLGWFLIILAGIILFVVFSGGSRSSGGGGAAPPRGTATAGGSGGASRGGGYASRRAAGGALNAAAEAQGSAPLLEQAPAEQATPSRGGYAARRKQAETES